MKTTFTHNSNYNFVELKQTITDNVTFTHIVYYGHSFTGLQTTITGIKNGVWNICINDYCKTMGEALNKLQNERLKRISKNIEMYQSSSAIWP